MNNNITQINLKKFTWHHLAANGEEEIRYLRDHFDFKASHLNDCAAPPLRPKIEFTDHYVFIVLAWPVYNRQSGLISQREIDIFIDKNYLVTLAAPDAAAINDFAQKMQTLPDWGAAHQSKTSLEVLLIMLEETFLSLFPMLNHVAWDIDNLDTQLFSDQERELLHKILTTKRNIVDIRKSMQTSRNVLRELAEGARGFFGVHKQEAAFKRLLTHTQDIWEQLENHMATIAAIQGANESLISFRLSNIMRMLTIISVITFPLTLLAAIFAIDPKGGMPFIESPYGFWKVVGIMGLMASAMLYLFRKHRWL